MNNQTAERDEVRRILGERLTESELDDAIAAQRREDAWRAQPWPYAPANHAHRYSTCHGPCEQGRKKCPTADACECAEKPPRSLARKCRDWLGVYRQYRDAGHTRRYAAQIAYGIAFKGLPF